MCRRRSAWPRPSGDSCRVGGASSSRTDRVSRSPGRAAQRAIPAFRRPRSIRRGTLILTCSTHGPLPVWIDPVWVDAEIANHLATAHAAGPTPDITAEGQPENPSEWPQKPIPAPEPDEKRPSEYGDGHIAAA